jgi:hypothetical protein
MEPIYIHKLPDGGIRRHQGEPVGDGDFILVEPSREIETKWPTFVVSKSESGSEKRSFVLYYVVAAVLGAAATAVLLNVF